MGNKYNAKETIIDDMKFPSMAEGDFYLHLKDLKDNGKIKDFGFQPKFVLIKKFTNCGKIYQEMTYTPDYVVFHLNGCNEYIDVKGMLTDRTAVKIKLLRSMYPDLKLTLLVQRGKKGNKKWMDIEKTKKVRGSKEKIYKEWEFWEGKN